MKEAELLNEVEMELLMFRIITRPKDRQKERDAASVKSEKRIKLPEVTKLPQVKLELAKPKLTGAWGVEETINTFKSETDSPSTKILVSPTINGLFCKLPNPKPT